MIIRPANGHCRCHCDTCLFLRVFPDMPFMSPPDANAIGQDRKLWELDCNYLGPLIDGKATLIRRGLKTDGGSIPQLAQSVIGNPWQMPFLAYFLLHDAEYAAELFKRKECDNRLLEGAENDGRIGWLKRNAVWSAVRIGGGAVWAGHTHKSIEAARQFCSSVGEREYWELVSCKFVT